MKTFTLLLMFFLFAACNSDKGPNSGDCQMVAQEDGTSSTCTLTDGPAPIVDETTDTPADSSEGSVVDSAPAPTPAPAPQPTPAPAPEPAPTPAPAPAPTTDGPTSSVPSAALTWDADIYYVNFSAIQEEKVVKAVELMKKVIASQAFKDGVINHTYNGQKTFVDNNGLTNTQIYQKILDGAEQMGNTTKNNTMDVELELYYAATSTIGYTYPNSTRIWMNTKYFNNYTPANVTGNLMHEWLHKLGFGHASSWSTSRDYSVPYAIGYLMERLAKTHQ